MLTATGYENEPLGHSISYATVKFKLVPKSGTSVNDKGRRADMAEIHSMLGQWLIDKCEDKAQQSMFMQDDYEVEIAVHLPGK